MGYGSLIVPELAEAAARTGDRALVGAALDWLSERTRVTPTEWLLGIEARVRALLSDGERRRAAGTASRSSGWAARRSARELARGHLLYGEWLRRERRRGEAREQLRTAHEMLDAMGIRRSPRGPGRELLATGETRPQAHRRDRRRADRPGGPGRAAGPRWPVQPADRRPAVHQRAHGPVPPGQGVRQARHQLAQPARAGPAWRPGRHRSALARRHWPGTGQCALATGGYERASPWLTIAGTPGSSAT